MMSLNGISTRHTCFHQACPQVFQNFETNPYNFTLIFNFHSGVFENDNNYVEFKDSISIQTTYTIVLQRLGFCL